MNSSINKKSTNNTTIYEDLSKYANAKPVRVEKTDIVVVGTGATGFTAAITALSKGKKVIMLEKMPIVGGNSHLAAGGMNAAGTRFQKAKIRNRDTSLGTPECVL